MPTCQKPSSVLVVYYRNTIFENLSTFRCTSCFVNTQIGCLYMTCRFLLGPHPRWSPRRSRPHPLHLRQTRENPRNPRTGHVCASSAVCGGTYRCRDDVELGLLEKRETIFIFMKSVICSMTRSRRDPRRFPLKSVAGKTFLKFPAHA